MNVVSFAEELEKKSKKELLEYANVQYAILVSLQDKVQKQEQEIKHLQELLACNVSPIIKSPELGIVEHQIGKLVEASNSRNLTSEEIKSLDVLIKNKLLLNGLPTTIPGEAKKKKDVPEAVLISIAKKES